MTSCDILATSVDALQNTEWGSLASVSSLVMATGQYEMKWRAGHSTVANSHRLYCWGGQQKDLHIIHYNDEKREFTSSVDIFHLPTLKWEKRSTTCTATPPAGVMDYACTNIRDSIFYFGGRCQPGNCFHNDLFELNTLTDEWREIINSSADNGPMRKIGCGMISFNMNGEDNLLVIGGFGHTPITTHNGYKYIPHPDIPNRCYTDEIHSVSVNSSPGQWKVPIITGNRPSLCADFSIHTLPGNRSVMFGGGIIDETGFRRVNDLFLLSFSQNTIDFKKVFISSVTTLKWPKARDGHAGTIINTISSNQQRISHLMVLGGLDSNLETLNDCWIMNLSSLIWYQINLPDSVTKRVYHSMSTYYISKERFWIVVTGGYSEHNRSNDTLTPITRSNITVIIELEYINEEWSVRGVWNTELETQRIMEKNIFEKESELLKLSVEMREKSDEITHLKTREVSLIDKSEKELQRSLEKKFEIVKELEAQVEDFKMIKESDAQGRDPPSILKKSPEVEDVYKLLRNKSAHWDDFARDLLVEYNFHQELLHEGSLTANAKLEKVLRKWMESESSEVTWRNLSEVLEQLQFLDIASEVKRYLERKEVMEKYHKKKDYTAYE